MAQVKFSSEKSPEFDYCRLSGGNRVFRFVQLKTQNWAGKKAILKSQCLPHIMAALAYSSQRRIGRPISNEEIRPI